MTDIFNPGLIVEASAYCALTYVEGVRAAFGLGLGETDPTVFFPGGVIIPGDQGGPLETLTHISSMPGAPLITDFSATVCEIQWRIPMRLYLDRGNLDNLERACAPFYGRYLTAFHEHATLGGTVNSARIGSFAIVPNSESGQPYLEITLLAWERMNLEATAGANWL